MEKNSSVREGNMAVKDNSGESGNGMSQVLEAEWRVWESVQS